MAEPVRAPVLDPRGRWARILAYCDGTPRRAGDILVAVRLPERGRNRERGRILRAIAAMADAGMLLNRPGGWLASPDALRELTRVRAESRTPTGKAA